MTWTWNSLIKKNKNKTCDADITNDAETTVNNNRLNLFWINCKTFVNITAYETIQNTYNSVLQLIISTDI